MKYARNFLFLYAALHIASGLLFPLLVNTPLFADYNSTLYKSFNSADPAAQEGMRFLLGLMGPTVASWGVLFLLVVRHGFAHPDRKIWWGMLLAGLVWAPYDSFLSWQHGIYSNLVLNAIALLALVLPLLLVRKEFLRTTP